MATGCCRGQWWLQGAVGGSDDYRELLLAFVGDGKHLLTWVTDTVASWSQSLRQVVEEGRGHSQRFHKHNLPYIMETFSPD